MKKNILVKIFVPIIGSLSAMTFFEWIGSNTVGGVTDSSGVPLTYYRAEYMTGEVFISKINLVLNFLIWYGVYFVIIHILQKILKKENSKNNEKI